MKTYTPTIGIEVHAELKTKTKMFCSSKNDPHAGEPNTHVCPICMGHPGTLPVVNEAAVLHVLKVGKALEGTLASYTEFDRKNYFYPDIPKGYQISQYLYPIVSGGSLCGVKITRVHLEEDTARSLHDESGSIVDYNRAGVPLMELVTEPVIHDAKTAGTFAKELQLLLRTLGVSDANMEKGEMRVEANISVSPTETFGTKVEVKNLNSFKSVEGAIEYEIKRQIEVLERGESVVQETRGWDEVKGKTFSQRIKETANDYRYFPDPDLVKFNLLDIASNIELPILPENKRYNYSNLGLSREQVESIIFAPEKDMFFCSVTDELNKESGLVKLAANYICTDLSALLGDEGEGFSKANSAAFAALIRLIGENKITSRVAKDLLSEVVLEGTDPLTLATDRGLLKTASMGDLEVVIKQIIASNEEVVAQVRDGKETALQFLVGQGMKQTKGAADPKVLLDLLKKEILQ